MAPDSLSPESVYSLLVMSLCGVSAWWAKNILNDKTMLRIFALIGSSAALYMIITIFVGSVFNEQ